MLYQLVGSLLNCYFYFRLFHLNYFMQVIIGPFTLCYFKLFYPRLLKAIQYTLGLEIKKIKNKDSNRLLTT